MSECLYKYFILNDQVKDCSEFDDNFLRKGKALYEVIRIIDGRPLFLERHFNRLENSSKLIGVELWITKDETKEKIKQLIKENNITMGNIKFVFNVDNKIFLAYFIKYHYPSKDDYENGVRTIFYHGERKNPNAKIINMDFRELVDKEIKEKKAYEAILVDRNGFITEGSKSNIFMIKDGKVITSPVEAVLPGITRNVIVEVCRDMGLEVLEEKVHYKDINNIDAIFISGTSPEVLPISKVEDMNFNSSRNEFVLKIMDGYNEAKRSL